MVNIKFGFIISAYPYSWTQTCSMTLNVSYTFKKNGNGNACLGQSLVDKGAEHSDDIMNQITLSIFP